MALNERLQRFLEKEGVAYETLPHHEAFTAREVAAESHVSERELAKVVTVEEHGRDPFMVVLPAARRLDLTALRHALLRDKLALAPEEKVAQLYPDCEIGAMPPFGNLYGLPVVADNCFHPDGAIVFRAGNHHEVVRMTYADFARLVRPVVGEFCLREGDKRISG